MPGLREVLELFFESRPVRGADDGLREGFILLTRFVKIELTEINSYSLYDEPTQRKRSAQLGVTLGRVFTYRYDYIFQVCTEL